MSRSKQSPLRANLDQGASPTEREGNGPLWGGPPHDVSPSVREYAGLGRLAYDTRQMPRMKDDLVFQAENINQAQHEHCITVLRNSAKQDFPSGTGRATGRIKATIQHGLGVAYARPGPSGHAVTDSPVSDYLANPTGPGADTLSKYVGAASIVQPGDEGSGYPHRIAHSQFPTMEDDILAGFQATTRAIASNYIPPAKPAAPRSNRDVGQPRAARKGAR